MMYMQLIHRRQFIKRTGCASIGAILGIGVLSSLTGKTYAIDASEAMKQVKYKPWSTNGELNGNPAHDGFEWQAILQAIPIPPNPESLFTPAGTALSLTEVIVSPPQMYLGVLVECTTRIVHHLSALPNVCVNPIVHRMGWSSDWTLTYEGNVYRSKNGGWQTNKYFCGVNGVEFVLQEQGADNPVPHGFFDSEGTMLQTPVNGDADTDPNSDSDRWKPSAMPGTVVGQGGVHYPLLNLAVVASSVPVQEGSIINQITFSEVDTAGHIGFNFECCFI